MPEPDNAYEALTLDDWVSWVKAIKRENDQWVKLDVDEELLYDARDKSAGFCPIRELYSKKFKTNDDGTAVYDRHKLRPVAGGHVLLSGRDFASTYSSTLPGEKCGT